MPEITSEITPAITAADNNALLERNCPRCGADNLCALANSAGGQSSGQCWCMRQPLKLPLPAAASASCYCPTCLAVIAAAVDEVRDAR